MELEDAQLDTLGTLLACGPRPLLEPTSPGPHATPMLTSPGPHVIIACPPRSPALGPM